VLEARQRIQQRIRQVSRPAKLLAL
jgi:hypothetical protein